MGFHIGHAISHAFHSVTHAVQKVTHEVLKPVEKIPVVGKLVSGVEHSINAVENATEKIANSAIQASIHPVQTIKHTVNNTASLIDDVAHGRFMHSLQDLGHLSDPIHAWHPIVESFEDQPVSKALAKGWHQVERPLNRELAHGIKKLTGHNVFGSKPLASIAQIAATIASMGGYSVVGGITSALESAASSLAASAAEGGIMSGIESGLATLAEYGAEAGVAFQAAQGLVESVPGMLGDAINSAAREFIPGVAPVENWVADTAKTAAGYFEKGVTAVGGQNKVTTAINNFVDKEVSKATAHLAGETYTGFGGSVWTEHPIDQIKNAVSGFTDAVKQGWEVGGSIQGTTAVQHFKGELGGALTYAGQDIGSGNAFGKALVNAGDALTGQLSEDLMTGTGYGMGSFGWTTDKATGKPMMVQGTLKDVALATNNFGGKGVFDKKWNSPDINTNNMLGNALSGANFGNAGNSMDDDSEGFDWLSSSQVKFLKAGGKKATAQLLDLGEDDLSIDEAPAIGIKQLYTPQNSNRLGGSISNAAQQALGY